MPAPIEVKLVLTGGRRGQNFRPNPNFNFIDGVCTFKGTEKQLGGLIKYAGISWQAYMVGSKELAEADKRDGQYYDQRAVERPDESEGDELRQVGTEPDPVQDVQFGGDDGSEADAAAGETVRLSDGDGHADSGVSGEQGESVDVSEEEGRILAALVQIDPEDDNHWTGQGLIKVSSVQEQLGDEEITRKMISEAAPGFDRDKAREFAEAQDLF